MISSGSRESDGDGDDGGEFGGDEFLNFFFLFFFSGGSTWGSIASRVIAISGSDGFLVKKRKKSKTVKTFLIY